MSVSYGVKIKSVIVSRGGVILGIMLEDISDYVVG
jgi:hypothetical protein